MARVDRHRRRATRVAQAATRRPLLLGVLVLGLGALLLVVGFMATSGPPFQQAYRLQVLVPGDGPTLRRGQAVRIGGRLAGLISDVQPGRGNGGSIVTANITKAGFRPLPVDTEAYVRVHSIVYETYLELRPGPSKVQLADNDTVRARADSGVDLLEAVQLFDAKARADLRRTVSGAGVGLAGRGRDLNRALADLPPLARDVAAQVGAATRDEGALGRIVAGAARTARGARGTRADDVAELITSGDRTLSALAERRDQIRAAVRRLPAFEDSVLATAPRLDPLLDDLAALTTELQPTARALNAALPSLNRALGRGEILRVDVGRIADVADPVLREARPGAYDLFPVMTTLGPLNDDLRTLLERIGPYRTTYRIPGVAGERQGSGEIAESGRRLIDATDDPFEGGKAKGAVAWRVLPVLSPRPCQNPFPAPEEADRDTTAGGRCLRGGRR